MQVHHFGKPRITFGFRLLPAAGLGGQIFLQRALLLLGLSECLLFPPFPSRTGVSLGLFQADDKPSRQAVADMVFRSGLSTAGQVTQVSGRGVGMDAARAFLAEQGASVAIVLLDEATELGFAPFQFVICVPAAAFRARS